MLTKSNKFFPVELSNLTFEMGRETLKLGLPTLRKRYEMAAFLEKNAEKLEEMTKDMGTELKNAHDALLWGYLLLINEDQKRFKNYTDFFNTFLDKASPEQILKLDTVVAYVLYEGEENKQKKKEMEKAMTKAMKAI